MSHRYRMAPAVEQAATMEDHCAQARFVWNVALEQRNCWRRGMPPLSGYDQKRQLVEARAWSEWLGGGSSAVQQQAVLDLDRAFQNWWGGSHRRPTWRRKGVNEGFTIRDLTVRKLNRKWATVYVPKVGPVKFRLHRPLPAGTKSARVTLDRAGRWHVSFVAVPPLVAGPGDGSTVGVDRGVACTAALSTGELLSAPKVDWGRTRRLQRQIARKQKDSNRRGRAYRALARHRAREADRRKNWVEQTSTMLARRFDAVVLEDLRVKNMTRSARGTIDAPGSNVAQKAGLNRSILDQGWGMLARRLADKIGDRMVLVPAAHTSTTCSTCGHRDRDSRESQARFVCRACGVVEHADVNAALNIARGHRVSARGGNRAIRRPGEARTTKPRP